MRTRPTATSASAASTCAGSRPAIVSRRSPPRWRAGRRGGSGAAARAAPAQAAPEPEPPAAHAARGRADRRPRAGPRAARAGRPAAPAGRPRPSTAVRAATPEAPQLGADHAAAARTVTATTSRRSRTAVEPGQRERVLALVRNQCGIVDNYELAVEGMPDDWWSVFPDTVYLVPFGTGGTYEQEVEIHLHPPRSPEAEARLWELQVVAHSKAHGRRGRRGAVRAGRSSRTRTRSHQAAPGARQGPPQGPLRRLGREQGQRAGAGRARGLGPRRRAGRSAFDRPPGRDPARATASTTTMRVKPPKQIWIGRPLEHRFEVHHADRRGGRGAPRRRAAAAEELRSTAPDADDRAVRPQRLRRRPARYAPARVQAAGPRAGRAASAPAASPAEAELPGPAAARPEDPSAELQRRPAQAEARRRRRLRRAPAGPPLLPTQARLPPEAVAAVVAAFPLLRLLLIARDR